MAGDALADPEPQAGPPAAELGEVLRQVEAAVATLASIADAGLSLTRLRKAAEDVLGEARMAEKAAKLLAGGAPMAETFPDGSRPRGLPTARQVIYLADLARPAGSGREEAHQRRGQALAQHDAGHGRHRSRPCESQASDGGRCGSLALVFIERAVCVSHASEDERATNRARREAWIQGHPFPEMLAKGKLRFR